MDRSPGSGDAARDAVHNPRRGDSSPPLDNRSEEAQSSNKYRRVDEEGTRASTSSDQAGRFLFVDSSSTGHRPRSDQRAINAHIQQTAHRNRRHAARRQRITGSANIGRNRRAPVLQPRPIEPQRPVLSSAALQQYGSFQRPSIPNLATSAASSSTVSIRSETRSPEPSVPARPPSPPEVDHEQLDRLRHYSNLRRPDLEDALIAQRDERSTSTEVAQLAGSSSGAEVNSVRSMLTQILQRLDAGHAGHAIPGVPNSSLKNTALDPFNISSIHITSSMNIALRHFSDVMIPRVFPTRHQGEIQTQWAFEKAAQQPLVLYALLAVASAERSARLGEVKSGSQTTYTEADLENRSVSEFVSYKVNAVKMANETMESMETAAQASTVFALMCLLSIEVITGNQTEILAHVSGLQKLIAWRGGYHGIPSYVTELILSYVIEMRVGGQMVEADRPRTSYMCAALTRSLPTAPPTSALPSLPTVRIQEIRQNVSDDVKKMSSGILTQEVDTLLDWRISQAFRDMRDVVQYREYYHEKQVLPVQEENEYINAKSYQFRYAALSAPFEPRAPASDKEESCRLAMLIFWFSNIQLTAPDSALSRTLTAQLKTALQASDLKGLWGPHYELLTWVLMLGAFISAGQRERPWFVVNLAKVSIVLKIQHWTELRQVLLKFFFLDRIYAKGMREIWEEASLLVESLD